MEGEETAGRYSEKGRLHRGRSLSSDSQNARLLLEIGISDIRLSTLR